MIQVTGRGRLEHRRRLEHVVDSPDLTLQRERMVVRGVKEEVEVTVIPTIPIMAVQTVAEMAEMVEGVEGVEVVTMVTMATMVTIVMESSRSITFSGSSTASVVNSFDHSRTAAMIQANGLELEEHDQRVVFQRLIILMLFTTVETPHSSEEIRAFFVENRYFSEPWRALQRDIHAAYKPLFRRSWDINIRTAIELMPYHRFNALSPTIRVICATGGMPKQRV